jgi:hypothetical protein
MHLRIARCIKGAKTTSGRREGSLCALIYDIRMHLKVCDRPADGASHQFLNSLWLSSSLPHHILLLSCNIASDPEDLEGPHTCSQVEQGYSVIEGDRVHSPSGNPSSTQSLP